MLPVPFINHNESNFDEICRNFKWRVPQKLNLAEYLCEKHGAGSSKVALYFEDEQGAQRRATFGELIRGSSKFANLLKAHGAKPGDRVCMILSQKLETVISHLGIYKLGAIALPLSVLFQKEALKYRLQNSGTKIVVIAEEDAHKVRELRDDLPDLEHLIIIGKPGEGEISFWGALEKASSEFEIYPTSANDPAILAYTSGTTGPPKGAVHAHRFMLGNLPGFELSHNFFPKKNDVFWSPADWAWGGGLFDALFPCLYYGVPILAYRESKFDPERAFYMLEKYKVRSMFVFPSALRMMRQIEDIRAKHSLDIRSIMSAGESVGESVFAWGQETLCVSINEMFGQTEANYVVGNCSAIMDVKPGAMGKAYPGLSVEVIDEEGNLLPAGEVGEVVVDRSNPGMFLGYWQNEQATKEKIVGNWWLMGDLVQKDEDGYLFYVGRKDDVICSAGYRIGPSEIENCLLHHPSVAEVAAVGSPHETRGEIVKAFIKLAPGYSPSDELAGELQTQVKKNLAFYAYPREVEFIEELPKTTTGKLRRVELKQREIEKKKGLISSTS